MEDLYFKDEATKIIFGLVVLKGQAQMDLLGIKMIHYTDKDASKAWYEKIKAKIAGYTHPKVVDARIALERIYGKMKN
jgi:putative uncharacterized protein FNV2246